MRIAINAIICLMALVTQSMAVVRLNWRQLFNRQSSVCYNDPPIGCFPNHGRFRNTAGFQPESPQVVQVTFIHHSAEGTVRFTWSQTQEVMAPRFDPTLKTVVLNHGYFESGTDQWITTMAQSFLAREESFNVFVVDWHRGAHNIIYHQGAANTKVTGAVTALFLQKLVDLGATPSLFHLIGLSLGAQVAGETGRRFPGIGRISGLDPASPCFEGHDPVVRLDASDADFVDVVHTDCGNGVLLSSGGRGMTTPCGTVDFYANGGNNQPGCQRGLMGNLAYLWSNNGFSRRAWQSVLGCDHVRSRQLFQSSLTDECDYQMYHCSSQRNARVNDCTSCSEGECPRFGYDVGTNFTGIYRFSTSSTSPYCCKLYRHFDVYLFG